MRHRRQMSTLDRASASLLQLLPLRLAFRYFNALGRARSQAAFRVEPGQEALPFPDALHFDRYRVDRLVETAEPLVDVLRDRRHRRGATPPDAARVGDDQREDDHEHEDAGENK